jgi:opacity protein-like surface antigen
MMRSVLAPAAAVAAVFFAGEVVRAADFPESPPIQPVQEFVSNWYVRGDAGYGVLSTTNGNDIGIAFTSRSLANAPTFDAGFGFKMDWFRSDLTVDYGTGSKFIGNNLTYSPDVTAQITNLTTLANVYFDLGTWWGLTPYIGGGAGFSYLRAGELTDASFSPTPGFQGANSNSWDFAWAANAGLAYYLSRNMLIDLSYRYLDMGTPRSNIPAAGTVSFGNVTAQQVRIGLRYQIN